MEHTVYITLRTNDPSITVDNKAMTDVPCDSDKTWAQFLSANQICVDEARHIIRANIGKRHGLNLPILASLNCTRDKFIFARIETMRSGSTRCIEPQKFHIRLTPYPHVIPMGTLAKQTGLPAASSIPVEIPRGEHGLARPKPNQAKSNP